MRIDLHTHSTASDGTDSPAGVLHAALAAGLDVVALTDHDTFSGLPAARVAAAQTGVRLVPGVEVSCVAGDVPFHLLAYWCDPDDADLAGHTVGGHRHFHDGGGRTMWGADDHDDNLSVREVRTPGDPPGGLR